VNSAFGARFGALPHRRSDTACRTIAARPTLSALSSTVQEIDIFGGANAVSDGGAVQVTSVVDDRRFF
jgi:hypothetical protein